MWLRVSLPTHMPLWPKFTVMWLQVSDDLVIILIINLIVIALTKIFEDLDSPAVNPWPVLTIKRFKNELTLLTPSLRIRVLATIFCGIHDFGGPFVSPGEIKTIASSILEGLFQAKVIHSSRITYNSYIKEIQDRPGNDLIQWWSYMDPEVVGKF